MQITEFREFDPAVFAVVHQVVLDLPELTLVLDDDAQAIVQALLRSADGARTSRLEQDALNLLQAAAKLKRFFIIRPPEAPGLLFCGGLLTHGSNKISVGGIGFSFADAFKRCIGEAVEYWSQIQDHESPAVQAISLQPGCTEWPDYWLNFLKNPAAKTLDCVPAKRLADGAAVYVPADLCLRRQNTQLNVPFKLSSGCAAGPVWESALAQAVGEVIERDAITLWWYGGVPAKRFSQEQLENLGLAGLLARCRSACQARQSTFLLLPSAGGLSSVFAYSFDQSSEHFACGMAAHWDTSKALTSALLELCQMELGLALVRLKIAQDGMNALNQGDQRQLQRASVIKPDCSALLADPITSIHPLAIDPANPADDLKKRLRTAKLTAYCIDMGKPSLAIPVAKVIIPELQAATPITLTNRLEAAIKKYGGGWGLRNNIGIY